ncbi:MAG: GNAT family N-acetyltransferase [archaeon]
MSGEKNSFEVRRATINDLGGIQKLNLLLFRKEHEEYDRFLNMEWTFSKTGTDYYKGMITRRDRCAFIAVKGGKTIGYLVGKTVPRKGAYRKIRNYAELDNMLVLEKHRGRKVGSMLVKAFLEWCGKKNIEMVNVSANFRNRRGINFYKKLGFREYSLWLELEMKKMRAKK